MCAHGCLVRSRWFMARMSTTQTLPSRSWWILCGKTKRPAPKLLSILAFFSSWWTGAQLEPAQVSNGNADWPGGTSGLAPQRSTTQRERPSLSTATPFSAPHLKPSGSLPQGATVLYGFGRSLVGVASRLETGAEPGMSAQAPSATTTTGTSSRLRIDPSLRRRMLARAARGVAIELFLVALHLLRVLLELAAVFVLLVLAHLVLVGLDLLLVVGDAAAMTVVLGGAELRRRFLLRVRGGAREQDRDHAYPDLFHRPSQW